MSSSETDGTLEKNKLSRRNFLKGAAAGGAIAAVAVAGASEMTLLSGQQPSSTTTVTTTVTQTQTGTQTTTAPPAPTTSTIITLTVNGVDRTTSVDNRWSLAETLRTKFDLIGTKIGCDRGDCGACSVLIDGVPMLSCMMLAIHSVGHQITTIEGIGSLEKLNNVQTALIDNDGVQCGFCMPGIVVVATAYLKQNPTPTDAQWRAVLAGNLCKCANWPFILQGLKAVKP
jgi:aerobic-type carbon monoxide dehydrogenase small subunit (CoxS/CutS family)